MNADREYLAAGCALGTLAEAEMLEARELEAADPTFAQDVQSFRETMGLLADSAPVDGRTVRRSPPRTLAAWS